MKQMLNGVNIVFYLLMLSLLWSRVLCHVLSVNFLPRVNSACSLVSSCTLNICFCQLQFLVFFFRDLHLYCTLFIKEKNIARKLYMKKTIRYNAQFWIVLISHSCAIRFASLYCRLTITCIVVISNCVLKDMGIENWEIAADFQSSI